MWQILIVALISVTLVSGDTNCPGFSNYLNNSTLVDALNGEYMVVFSSCSYILNCERISWTVGPNNERTAYLKDSHGCCRRIDNFDSSNLNYIQYKLSPHQSTCAHLPETVSVSNKLVASTGTGIEQCLVIYVCHPYRNGLLVVCREEPDWSLWTVINQLLGSLLNLLSPTPIFEKCKSTQMHLH